MTSTNPKIGDEVIIHYTGYEGAYVGMKAEIFEVCNEGLSYKVLLPKTKEKETPLDFQFRIVGPLYLKDLELVPKKPSLKRRKKKRK